MNPDPVFNAGLCMGLLLLNLWGLAMWRGAVARQWIEIQSARRRLTSWPTLGYPISGLTTAAPWFALTLDLLFAMLLVDWLVGRGLREEPVDYAAIVVVIAALGLWWSVAYFERPRWALPPWYRRWRLNPTVSVDDTVHDVTITYATDERASFKPYVVALCKCGWVGDIHGTHLDRATQEERARDDALKHTSNVRPGVRDIVTH